MGVWGVDMFLGPYKAFLRFILQLCTCGAAVACTLPTACCCVWQLCLSLLGHCRGPPCWGPHMVLARPLAPSRPTLAGGLRHASGPPAPGTPGTCPWTVPRPGSTDGAVLAHPLPLRPVAGGVAQLALPFPWAGALALALALAVSTGGALSARPWAVPCCPLGVPVTVPSRSAEWGHRRRCSVVPGRAPCSGWGAAAPAPW